MKVKNCVAESEKSVNKMGSVYPIKGVGRITKKLIECDKCRKKYLDPVSYATHAVRCRSVNMESSSFPGKSVTAIFQIAKKQRDQMQCKLKDSNRTSHNAMTTTPKFRRSREELLQAYPIKGIGHTARKLIKCQKCCGKFSHPALYATHFEDCISSRVRNGFKQ